MVFKKSPFKDDSDIHCTKHLTLEILRQKEEHGGQCGCREKATANIITGETDMFIALKVPQAVSARPSGKGRPETQKSIGKRRKQHEGTAGNTQQQKESGQLG